MLTTPRIFTFSALASSSAGNLYVLDCAADRLLIECGLSFREARRAVGFSMSGVSGWLVSHEHGDHARGVRDALRAGVDCYMSEGTARAVVGEPGHHRLNILRPRVPAQIGPWRVMPFETVHDAAEPLGFLVAHDNSTEKLLFATDTAYIRHRFMGGITHLAVECNYQLEVLRENAHAGRVARAVKRRTIRNHMGLGTLLEFIRATDTSRLREVHLMHLSDNNSNEQEIRLAVQRATGVLVTVCGRRGL